MIHLPANLRLIDPATDDDRRAWNDYRAVNLSGISLTTYVIRRRMAYGATLSEVAR